jgi:hypothetical protein
MMTQRPLAQPLRKIGIYVESANPVEAQLSGSHVRRGFAAAVLPGAARCFEDLDRAADIGEWLGRALTEQLLAALRWEQSSALAYGKAAIVGSAGFLEDGAAILHPRMGAPLRALIGQGTSIIPSTVKRGAPGARIDVPLHGAANEWDFAMIDSIEATVNDAPLADEIVVIVALAVGRRAGVVIGV